MAQLALDVFLGIRPDTIGMREIGAPHDVILANLVDHLDADAIGLISGITLPAPILTRPHLEVEILELVLPFQIHVVEDIRNPANSALADDNPNLRMMLQHAG